MAIGMVGASILGLQTHNSPGIAHTAYLATAENLVVRLEGDVEDDAVEQPNGISGDVPMTADDFDEDENLMHEEMRILVKVCSWIVVRG